MLTISKLRFITRVSIRFVLYFWYVAKLEIIFSIFLKIGQAIIPSLHLLVTKLLIDSISNVLQGDVAIDIVIKYLGLQAITMVLSHILIAIDRLNSIKMQNKITYATEEKIITKTSTIPILHFEKSEFYDQLLRVSSGQSQRVVEMFNGPLNILQNLLTLTTIIGLISTIHWITSISVVIFAIFPLIINIKVSKLNFKLNKEITPLTRLINYFLNLLKHRDSAKEIRVFQLQNHLIDRWRRLYVTYTRKKFSFEVYSTYLRTGTEIFTTLLIAVNLGFIIWVGIKNKLTIGDYTAITQAFVSVQGILVSLSYSVSSLYANALAIQELIQFLEMSDELTTEYNNIDKSFSNEDKDFIGNGIVVKDLQFSYDNNRVVLDHLSFSIKPGERVAIVGDNGAGKSTLVKCLLGLYRTYDGSIYYGNKELKQLPINRVFNHVSALFQDFGKYELTVSENISFGNIKYIHDQDKILEASKKGGAYTFINQLPFGFNTQLGRSFNGGTEISGGQWHRIAISRAFIRDSEVIILDEPAASLDPFAEASLYENFANLSKGKTTILISHRLSSCVNADLILVMREGKIVEQGKHEELLAQNGYYAKMFLLQANSYQKGTVLS
ncbi:MAG: ABC transporter ATP-binding protein [Paenibacillus macerans]|uniref:ATP-binding cassette domain-containing protein n=1 Tax=Paenibacillus macerans TaxID=44252 RepID=A0A6N8EN07_PAEMA|nr:ABC transporter ATP-binding protein [Paenibacillus macerans]MDU7473161.1 ABC transporter ATP-binding protein [Paenibacillus macerans]MEC0139809.1 ABC transporter ATP-binding protein [Paenibacillus macerans]MUG21339.1 ATP-binding cassette domain-containing protein [Paenibacillus macerans]